MTVRVTSAVISTAPTTAGHVHPNALAHGLRVLGDEWAMLIVQRALLGDRRYGDFKASLPISDAVLTGRLTELVDLGLLRHVPDRVGGRSSYQLDGMGRGLWPVHLLIWDWEQSWAVRDGHGLPTMRHRSCGRVFRPVLTCGSCGERADPRAMTAAWGPAGGWERSIPRAGRRRRSATRGPGRFRATMGVVASHWSLAVIVAALWGTRRYGDFQETLSMSPAILSERLKTLVAEGFLTEQPTATRADWSEYHPTPRTIAFLPVFAVMVAWAERWFGEPGGPSVVLTHSSCGDVLRPRLRCDQCRDLLVSGDVIAEEAGSGHGGDPAAYSDN